MVTFLVLVLSRVAGPLSRTRPPVLRVVPVTEQRKKGGAVTAIVPILGRVRTLLRWLSVRGTPRVVVTRRVPVKLWRHIVIILA